MVYLFRVPCGKIEIYPKILSCLIEHSGLFSSTLGSIRTEEEGDKSIERIKGELNRQERILNMDWAPGEGTGVHMTTNHVPLDRAVWLKTSSLPWECTLSIVRI